jgi:hypothetical protein
MTRIEDLDELADALQGAIAELAAAIKDEPTAFENGPELLHEIAAILGVE